MARRYHPPNSIPATITPIYIMPVRLRNNRFFISYKIIFKSSYKSADFEIFRQKSLVIGVLKPKYIEILS